MSRKTGFWAKVGVTVAGAALVVTGATAATTASASEKAAPAPAIATVTVRSGPNGQYLADGQGNSLYLFLADTGNTSQCNGQCAAAWPPLTTSGTPQAGTGVDGSKLNTSNRSDGSKQVTYNNHPLYRFADDTAVGQTNGQGVNAFGALWWLVNPAGDAITTKAGGTPAPGGVTY